MKNLIIATVLLVAFQYPLNAQTQIGTDIDGEAAGDYSGQSVALSDDGTTLAVGANLNGGNGVLAGHVRVYKNMLGTWTQIGADIDGEGAGDESGQSVSLSSDGTILAIGAYKNTNANGNSGHVRVYQYALGTWTQIGQDIDGDAAGDENGYSVSLSSDGTIMAVGAFDNDAIASNSGKVRIYQYASGTDTWTQLGGDINGVNSNDYNGISVSLSNNGTIVSIGAWGTDLPGSQAGYVRVFEYVSGTGTWTQLGADIRGERSGDRSGWSASLSGDGNIVAIGGYLNDDANINAGHVRVYQYTLGSNTWTKVGADIDGEAFGDFFGFCVSLSDDGSTVAMGAFANNSNGDNAGRAQVYKNVSGTWTQLGLNIDGEAANDESARNLWLSGDGNTLAIGATKNDGVNGADSGHVRVYDLSGIPLSSDSFVLANFSVYPNPSSELVTISLTRDLKLEKVNIYNTLGQFIKTENKAIIAVDTLSKGNYFFEIFTNKGKAIKLIVVK